MRLEIQTYYLLPPRGHDAAATSPQQRRHDAARAGATARAVLREALALDRQRRFLRYAPHWYFRALLAALCVVSTVRTFTAATTTAADENTNDDDDAAAIADGIEIARRSIVQDGDLPARLAALLESYYRLGVVPGRESGPNGEPVSRTFTHRLGASVTFACVKRWKDELANARSKNQPSSSPPPPPPQPSMLLPPNVSADSDEVLTGSDVADAAGIDLLAGVDWSFMDDFDWGLEPALPGAGAGWQ